MSAHPTYHATARVMDEEMRRRVEFHKIRHCNLWIAVISPLLSVILLVLYMKYRIGGYTGDCCGASSLICKVSMIFGVVLSLVL